MAAFSKFDQFVTDLGLKVHNLDTDTLKVMLTNTAPSASNTVKANITEISAGNGYTAGGVDAQGVWSGTSGIATLTCTNVVITASGGSIGPFRYAVLYNDTQTSPSKPLIGFWDNGSSITLNDTESVTIVLAGNILSLT